MLCQRETRCTTYEKAEDEKVDHVKQTGGEERGGQIPLDRSYSWGVGGQYNIDPQNEGQSREDDKETGVVYYGPISNTIKKVKLLSFSTCCLSVSLGLVVTFMTSPDMNVILKGAVASSVIFFSATTTAALHWFVSPYIHKLRWQPGSDSFKVEMMS